MTTKEFQEYVEEHFPEGSIGVDNEGQIIIYTNLMFDGEHILCLHQSVYPGKPCPFVPKEEH